MPDFPSVNVSKQFKNWGTREDEAFRHRKGLGYRFSHRLMVSGNIIHDSTIRLGSIDIQGIIRAHHSECTCIIFNIDMTPRPL